MKTLNLHFWDTPSDQGKPKREVEIHLPVFCQLSVIKQKTHIRETIKNWYLLHQPGNNLIDLSDKYNPVIRGWINYYGKYCRSELAKVIQHLNYHLVMWVMRKFKRYKRKKRSAVEYLHYISTKEPNLFAHWSINILPN